ncbi:sugar porter family MFS transporter [Catenovulum sp. 2E275]|uniref:sugar porter family MFS transporter n=1 Tax=Catenovulum sp. 2E275 TaxID=2980497 RepID=UPI0021D29D80|nr:sugar porter family MFS transporter [Catenovulum sp. 2E275]MCU4675954.1 sugar porter family MFS transporter [Catenovulum sp. 2E275]
MNNLFYWSVTVAVAGFLFGFDTAVISGADTLIQQQWQTSDFFHGAFIMSSALWGTVLGALLAKWPCDILGRKKALLVVAFLYLISAIGSALAPDPYSFSIYRFIGGLGVGASSIAVPAYISEIAPAKHRGRLVALYQFQLVFGILVAFSSNYFISGTSDHDWRWMLAVEIVPAFLFLLMLSKVPESPRWLVLFQQNRSAALKVLNDLKEPDPDKVIAEIEAEENKTNAHSIWQAKFKFPILLAVLIAFFNQLSGINFIIYFAPRVFNLAGLDTSSALLSSAGIGLVNLAFTMLGVYLIDKVGRKKLMLIGSVGYIVSLLIVAFAFANQSSGLIVVLAIFAFIASHAVGQGAVIWVFIAEIFPNSVRSSGQALGCGTHWVLAALITLVMPVALSQFAVADIFYFFAFMMFLQLLFVVFLMPETKGRSLEEIALDFKTKKPAAQNAEYVNAKH